MFFLLNLTTVKYYIYGRIRFEEEHLATVYIVIVTCYSKTVTRENNKGIKHGFSCINIRQVSWEVLKTEAEGRGFQHLPRDLANVMRVLQKVFSLGSDFLSATFYQTYFYYKPSKYSPFAETHFCNLFTQSRKADKYFSFGICRRH